MQVRLPFVCYLSSESLMEHSSSHLTAGRRPDFFVLLR